MGGGEERTFWKIRRRTFFRGGRSRGFAQPRNAWFFVFSKYTVVMHGRRARIQRSFLSISPSLSNRRPVTKEEPRPSKWSISPLEACASRFLDLSCTLPTLRSIKPRINLAIFRFFFCREDNQLSVFPSLLFFPQFSFAFCRRWRHRASAKHGMQPSRQFSSWWDEADEIFPFCSGVVSRLLCFPRVDCFLPSNFALFLYHFVSLFISFSFYFVTEP